MKNRFLVLMLGLLLLSGCSGLSTSTLDRQLREAVQSASIVDFNAVNNIQKTLYTYYLPPHLGRIQSTETASILRSGNVNILMNLDVIDVIADTYYETKNVFKQLVAQSQSLLSFDGELTNAQLKTLTYKVTIISIGNQEVLLTLESGYFILTAITATVDAPDILEDMVLLVRSAQVDKERVLVAYSTRESIDYQQETIDLFEQIAPESGSVLDMISGGDPIDFPEDTESDIPPTDDLIPTDPDITN
jgi:hypothetical protein